MDAARSISARRFVAEVESFLNDPAAWSGPHSGIAQFGQDQSA
jgi:orotate phosphoribosyltransferase